MKLLANYASGEGEGALWYKGGISIINSQYCGMDIKHSEMGGIKYVK